MDIKIVNEKQKSHNHTADNSFFIFETSDVMYRFTQFYPRKTKKSLTENLVLKRK